MFTVDVLPLRDGGGCDATITKVIADGWTASTPNKSYLFCKDKIGDNEESKWSQLLRSFNPHTLLTDSVCCEGNGNFGCATSFDKAGELERCSTWFRCLVKDVRGMLPKKKQAQRRSDYPFPTNNPSEVSLPPNQNNTSREKTEVEVSQEKALLTKNKTKEKEYVWYEMTFITRWEKDCCSMLCVNTPTKMKARIEDVIKGGSMVLDFSDPFSMYIPLMDEIVKLYDISVWTIRDVLRPIEKNRESHEGDFTPEFSRLQEIYRHSIHVGEVLSVTVGTTEEMRKCRKKILHGSSGSADTAQLRDKTQYHMAFQTQLIRNLRLRQQSNQDRLQTEITLGFNMITMRDSRVLKSDSKAMKTVALVTMVFLPATFTSAIFSTSFFDLTPASGSEPEKWSVSGKIYIFCIVSVVLTVLTFFVWFLWQYREGRDFKRAKDLEKQE